MRRKNIFRRIFLNKYFIATLIFIVVILFIENDNVFKIIKLDKMLQSMENEIKEYDRVYTEDSITLEKLKTDSAFREKYAREHYYLKNADEDVYVIKRTNSETKANQDTDNIE